VFGCFQGKLPEKIIISGRPESAINRGVNGVVKLAPHFTTDYWKIKRMENSGIGDEFLDVRLQTPAGLRLFFHEGSEIVQGLA
jgi:hypothetical protein